MKASGREGLLRGRRRCTTSQKGAYVDARRSTRATRRSQILKRGAPPSSRTTARRRGTWATACSASRSRRRRTASTRTSSRCSRRRSSGPRRDFRGARRRQRRASTSASARTCSSSSWPRAQKAVGADPADGRAATRTRCSGMKYATRAGGRRAVRDDARRAASSSASACDAVQAAAETYSGLVEVGVGLIPGGAGNMNMLWRALDAIPEGTNVNTYEYVTQVFKNIALAKVATSAEEAKSVRLLPAARTACQFDRARQLTEAKTAGARPRARRATTRRRRARTRLPGESGIATLVDDGRYARRRRLRERARREDRAEARRGPLRRRAAARRAR